jgi:hypothetical protein
MGVTAARFFSLLFAALALAPALAHLLELPNKIGLSRDNYLVVQQIYRGWALLGIVVLGALLSTLILSDARHPGRCFCGRQSLSCHSGYSGVECVNAA